MEKRIIQLDEGQQLGAVWQTTLTAIDDPKNEKFQPGQYVFKDANGKVLKVVTFTGQTSKVQHSFAAQLDMNQLVKPLLDKGLLRHSIKWEGEYDDIPAVTFQEAQFTVARGKTMFESLPSHIRSQFEGPADFLAHVQDPKNAEWLKKHGVLKGLDGLDADGKKTGYDPAKADADKVAAENAAAKAARDSKNSDSE